MKVVKGNKVSVDYEGTLDDGTVFDSSIHGDHSHPIEFTVGSGEVISGFDEGLMGMEVGQEKKITIEVDDAYGPVRKELVREFPRNLIPQNEKIEVGMELALGTPDGQQIPARITALSTEKVTLDLNHPLAGKRLHFKLKLVKIIS